MMLEAKGIESLCGPFVFACLLVPLFGEGVCDQFGEEGKVTERSAPLILWKWSRLLADALSQLEGEVIVWENRKKNDRGADCLTSADCVDCRVPNYGPDFSSHKFAKKGGLRYEVALCIQTGHVVWINGPFPCGKYNDIKIFRRALISHLEDGERVEADDAYVGEHPEFIKCPKGFANPEETEAM
ncbi:expressed unknown protein [Seminavis robusta]|uniref:DDE Tnp4 domain-containing protein n=1 Tax=Seminavis robusta TaxID=568900 RepID=A0A9N8DJ10_9STRA|nr:expressed unknown protein [Seminavis robusta]|eukprot:Sro168_g074750.1 n/a (185) ;mRNA; r:31433-32174